MKKKFTAKDILIPTVSLFVICLVVTALLAVTNMLTAPQIQKLSKETEDKTKAEVLASADEFSDALTVSADGKDYTYYEGSASGDTIGYVFKTSAKGYGGDIDLMVGIDTSGKVTGVSILSRRLAEKKTIFQEFSKGLLKENPVLRLVLGTCPTLATTTSLESAIGMGLSAAIVLVCSNIVISALRKVIPSKVRIPCYIVVIAGFVTIVQMLVKAYLPALNDMLGVYLPLIVVNCIILGRAEAFAGKNSVIRSAADGLGMGIGFTCALIIMGGVRELLGAGKLLGFQVLPESIPPMTIFVSAPGGFFVFGLVMACANRLAEKKGKPKAELHSCGSCPMAASCSLKDSGDKCENEKKEAAE